MFSRTVLFSSTHTSHGFLTNHHKCEAKSSSYFGDAALTKLFKEREIHKTTNKYSVNLLKCFFKCDHINYFVMIIKYLLLCYKINNWYKYIYNIVESYQQKDSYDDI